uniref:Uncharacterized protein n=1 Tax=Candidatus Kentrum sp. UNK TaxID=2126344 RepID=A0A451AQI1_9GAMM|nr:MAG: hypothetical protein BECKUNK1418G_GA0071005_12214 [Candidatus Kentron sp. UNK]VFK73513.1 MAG: hypothetical protein BECKUNK1418H_GA0071006_12134 [Candidatus Kentron sp. UNK]
MAFSAKWILGFRSRTNRKVEPTRAKVDDGIGFDKEVSAKNAVDMVSIVESAQFDREIFHATVSDPEKVDFLFEHILDTAYATDTVYCIIRFGRQVYRSDRIYLKNSPPGSCVEEDVPDGQLAAAIYQIDRYEWESSNQRNIHEAIRAPNQ